MSTIVGSYENAFEKEGAWKGCRPLYWPTTFVCAFIMSKMSESRCCESEIALWNQCAQKALAWLESKIQSDEELERIFLRAESILSVVRY